MPRPNPETWSTPAWWTSNYAGSYWASSRGYRRTYNSVNTPGYPAEKRFNPYSMEILNQWYDANAFWSKYQEWPLYGNHHWAIGPMDGSSAGVPGGWRLHFNEELSSLYSRASTNLRLKVKNSKVNIAVSLAEGGQVSRMFSDTARRIAGAYRALRHGDIPGVKKHINVKRRHAESLARRGPLDLRRHAPQYWLELQYGWKPLLGDLYGTVTQFHSRVQEGYPIRTRSGSSGIFTRADPNLLCLGLVHANAHQLQRTKVRYLVEYWVDSSAPANLNDWGLTNPLEVAWELVPYSFVVDWFLPVGDFLSSLDAYLGITFRRGTMSVLSDTYSSAVYKAAKVVGHVTNAQGYDRFIHTTYHRTVLTGLPGLSAPRLKNPLSKVHAANAISLLSLAFDRNTARNFRR